MLQKVATLEPLGLVLKPNKLAQYPDGAELIALGSVHNGAGTCENAPAFETVWTIDAGAPVLRAEIIPTSGLHACAFQDCGRLAVFVGRWCGVPSTLQHRLTRTRLALILRSTVVLAGHSRATAFGSRRTTGVMVFDYIIPANATERAPRLAGMFTPAITAVPLTGIECRCSKRWRAGAPGCCSRSTLP
jgi:hypothetical protein